jgi:hypothetical protein
MGKPISPDASGIADDDGVMADGESGAAQADITSNAATATMCLITTF